MLGWLLLHFLFILIHTTVIVINTIGWLIPTLRPLQRILLTITWLSWIAGALWMQTPGYCFLTDWHWQIQKHLFGHPPQESSFITWAIHQICQCTLPEPTIDATVALLMIIITIGTIITSYTDFKKRKKRKHTQPPKPQQ